MTDPKVISRIEALDVAITQLDDSELANILLRIVKELVVIHYQIDVSAVKK